MVFGSEKLEVVGGMRVGGCGGGEEAICLLSYWMLL